jgi:tetratricopeptide (TPR) repeat protein
VPFERNPSFTSRESEMTRLRQALFAGQQTAKVAITGLGGVGKTQLALELVYRIRAEHKSCSVIWIPATSKESLAQAYLNAARELCIPGCEDDKADVKKLVRDYLSRESAGQWLLIFDNVDDVDMWTDKPQEESGRLIDSLPRSSRGAIIFTTRDKKTAVKLARRRVIEMSEMDPAGGEQLLRNYLVDQDLLNNHTAAMALLTQLTYLPLAIVQATEYINENGIGLQDYLSLLEEQEEDVIELLSEDFEDEGRYRDVKNPVATTWLISFEQMRQRDALAADYLSFMACVDAKDIPQSLLPPGQSRKQETEAMGTLQGYSFIAKRSADSDVNIHRLVHLATRNWLRKEGLLLSWTGRVIERLAELLADVGHHNRVVWRSYMPHAYYALELSRVGEWNENRLDLLRQYAMCLYYDGRYWEAEGLFRQVMERSKTKLGADHPDTLSSMANLASTYRNQGRWEEAEKLEVQVMETSKTRLGADHPSTLSSMANLASTYRNQGRWEEAEKLEVQVMETSKTRLGADHPDTLSSMANLASTYRNQGRWEEAEKLFVQVMERSKTGLGVDHPLTLRSMANLASTYRNQGRWEEAEKLEVQVMETSKTRLGADHPDTLSSMANLASTYWDQGRLEEAEKLDVQVMETRKTRLGADHPSTLSSMANLASTYRNQGRWEEAEKLFVQVMETRKMKLGADHPDTLTPMANLASTYWNQGRWEEAEKTMPLTPTSSRPAQHTTSTLVRSGPTSTRSS